MFKILPLLLLMGCATTSLDDLTRDAVACSNAKAIGCDAMWDEINRKEEAIERRRLRRAPTGCPKHYILFKGRWGHESCITQWQMRQIFR